MVSVWLLPSVKTNCRWCMLVCSSPVVVLLVEKSVFQFAPPKVACPNACQEASESSGTRGSTASLKHSIISGLRCSVEAPPSHLRTRIGGASEKSFGGCCCQRKEMSSICLCQRKKIGSRMAVTGVFITPGTSLGKSRGSLTLARKTCPKL